MSGDLRTRIAAVVDPLIDPPCCDECKPFRPSDFAYEVADAVIRELEADYVLVPKGHTIARIRSAEKLGLTGDGR